MFREASWVVIAGNKRSFVGCKSVFPGGFAGSLVNFGGQVDLGVVVKGTGCPMDWRGLYYIFGEIFRPNNVTGVETDQSAPSGWA